MIHQTRLDVLVDGSAASRAAWPDDELSREDVIIEWAITAVDRHSPRSLGELDFQPRAD